ncbi:MAG: mitochondrial fission ELM1 family protein [Rhodospirillaceae bacterium]|nr:mitochondrial fission ELM1 family protein [Rhodospirillaceae bacterium]
MDQNQQNTESNQRVLWLLIDDRPGNAGQVRGVAEALSAEMNWPREGAGSPFVEKKIAYTSLAKLPNIVRGSSLVGVTPETAAGLKVDGASGHAWPDLVIAAGRRTAPVARWVKKAAQGQGKKTLIVQVMNPGRAGSDAFDLIAVPKHDCTRPDGDAPNVMRITGAPHRFSPARLEAERQAWAGLMTGIPRPFIALFVGGATKARPFPAELASDLATKVSAAAAELGGSVLLSTSRRTGSEAEAALLAATPEPRHTFIWGRDGESGKPNPFAGYLALADAVVVTGDSVSMCSEACANTGPVYIYAPRGMVSAKHARLHRDLFALGAARPFSLWHHGGTFEDWTHAPVNAAAEVAQRIAGLLKEAGLPRKQAS